MANRRTIAVILAGGTGSRVGLRIPKQLVKIAGKTVLEHTIKVFQEASVVDEVLVLMHPDHLEAARAIARSYPKVTHVLAGGATRNESTRAALVALGNIADPDDRVLFHDAVRPMLDEQIIEQCVEALDTYDAVDVAIPSADTIIEVDDHNVIADIPARSHLRRGQTPQCFRLSTITKAYEIAWQDPNFVATDDCSVVLKYLPESPITVVTGSDQNMKITEPIDIFIADKLFQIGTTTPALPANVEEYSHHLAGKVMVVLGGSYGIGADIAEMAEGFGATVHRYSRSGTGTHVENREEVAEALREAYEKSGRIDYVVVTAGLLLRGPLVEMTPEQIENTINVNYLAAVIAAQLSLRYLTETNGQLLLFTSSSYTRGRSDYSIYSSTKAAIVNLVQALAEEWEPLGVRTNCMNPERTATPMRTHAFGKEPAGTLLSSKVVALTALDVLLSDFSGRVIDVRRVEPKEGSMTRSVADVDAVLNALIGQETISADDVQ